MKTKIAQTVQAALKESRKVKITFKRDAISEVNYLLGMVRSGIVSLGKADETVLGIVIQTNNWSVDSNRTVIVTLTDKFDERWFVERLYRALEKIEVVA